MKLHYQLIAMRDLAYKSHENQYRKDGVTPYTKHLESVENFTYKFYGNDLKLRIISYAHDLIEDTEVTKEGLLDRDFDAEIVDAVTILTKIKGESYMDYLSKVKANDLARKVKIADMISNLADDPSERQIRKYAVGLEYLTK